MKRYMLTAEQLSKLIILASDAKEADEVVSGAIEVPDWATHFYCEHHDAGGYVPYIREIAK